MNLKSLTWPEVEKCRLESKVVIVPLGSLEQHGHHLPLITDTALVEGVVQGIQRRMPDEIMLLPALWCGHSTHHLEFPGTISISQSTYQLVIQDICNSLVRAGARRILLLNGHGGNDIPVRFALREVKSTHSEIPDLKIVFASYWNLAAAALRKVRQSEIGGMGHACEMETSLMLYLHDDLVKMNRARRDGPQQIPPYRLCDMQQGLPYYMVEEFHEISETGTVGHPDLASKEKGRLFYEGILDAVCAFIKDFGSW